MQNMLDFDIAFAVGDDISVILVSENDQGILRFIAGGAQYVEISRPLKSNADIDFVIKKSFNENKSLEIELEKSVKNPKMLLPKDWSARIGQLIEVKLIAAVHLPSEKKIAVAIGTSNSHHYDFISYECREKSNRMLMEHHAAYEVFRANIESERSKIEALFKEPEAQSAKNFSDMELAIKEKREAPILNTAELLPLLPKGTAFRVGTAAINTIERRAIQAITAST